MHIKGAFGLNCLGYQLDASRMRTCPNINRPTKYPASTAEKRPTNALAPIDICCLNVENVSCRACCVDKRGTRCKVQSINSHTRLCARVKRSTKLMATRRA